MDLSAVDALPDDFRQHGLQFGDQMRHIFLMNEGMLLCAGQGNRLLLRKNSVEELRHA